MRAIEVRGLGKRYRLGELGSMTLREAAVNLRRRDRGPDEEVWALRDLDLDVEQGEVLGLVGRNGAGKSTLLKLLARITEPTVGVSRTRGRVGSLLDVGTGFHGELTGRENVYVNGALLGLSRREINRRMDAIVDFAEVGRFMDTPLKRFSSGMQLRLAFAIAAEIEPEIVVVDEVLAVGDAEFQRRCLGRMEDMQRDGRTVLFVSHDAGTMTRLCSRIAWLESGRVVRDGPSKEVMEAYLATIDSQDGEVVLEAPEDTATAPVRVSVRSASGGSPRRDEALELRAVVHIGERTRGLDAAFVLATDDGTRVLDEALSDHGRTLDLPAGSCVTVAATVPPVLTSGRYRLSLWLGTSYGTLFEEPVQQFVLEPAIDDTDESAQRSRLVRPAVRWSVEKGTTAP